MPAQKRSLSDNPDIDEEDAPSSPVQNGHQYPKQSRLDPPPLDDTELHQQQELDEEEEEEDDEAPHKPEEDAEGQEDEEQEEQAEEKQPAQGYFLFFSLSF